MLRLLILLLIIGVLSSPLWLAVLMLESQPRLVDSASLSVDDVAAARRLLRENNPRYLRDGERRQVELTERQLNLMLRYALPEGAAARIALAPGVLTVVASIPVTEARSQSYVNTELILLQEGKRFEPLTVTAGPVSFPRWMAGGLTKLGDRLLRSMVPEYGEVLDAIESVEITEQRLALGYRWRSELLARVRERGREFVLPTEQRRQIRVYYRILADRATTLRPGASLAEVMAPLFDEALRRSQDGSDPAEENRAAILALAMAVQGINGNRLSPDGAAPMPRVRLPVTLHGRRDLAQHFTVSAALAAGGGGTFADAIGVFKELSDSQGGSGFSFPDLLADRAGVVFAQRATGSKARLIQGALAPGIAETALIPSIDRLPEGLQDLDFRARYEDLDAPAYRGAREELERRIAALELYR